MKFDYTADQLKVVTMMLFSFPVAPGTPVTCATTRTFIKFIQDFKKSGKLIAAICHAPVVLASADILKGGKLTGYWNIRLI